MLKQVLHRLASIAMAVLLLFSTVSFTVEKHFCGDVLIDVAVFSAAEKCNMEASGDTKEQIAKMPCCKDTLDVIEGQNQLKVKTFDDLNFETQQFLYAYVYSFKVLFETLPILNNAYKHYKPPNLIADIQVLDQVFLI